MFLLVEIYTEESRDMLFKKVLLFIHEKMNLLADILSNTHISYFEEGVE